MPRRPTLSNNLAARVRTALGLTQHELARFLKVTRAQVGHVEAGRSTFSDAVESRLYSLLEALPTPLGLAPALPAPPGAPAAGPLRRAPLEARLRECRYRAAVLHHELRELDARLSALDHRRRALAGLRAYLLPTAGPAPRLARGGLDEAQLRRWLDGLDADTVLPPGAPDASERALLALRLRLLEDEAAALEQLVAAAPPAADA